MKQIDLSLYGIGEAKEIFHNPSYDMLYKHETDP
ncbi:MAG TPA: phosphoenolpyruvate carboxykinase, partial [Bacteroidales bacterium]|nr:phosphoenolpyruvate carboxykinase [Bacteroidales bacterium]